MRMTELVPGQSFRGLSIHNLLGKGPDEAAYLASHPVLAVPLVVKTFPGADEGWLRDLKLLARVNSPHMIGVVDAGVEDGMSFMVCHHVDGIDLGELLAYLQPLDRVLPMHQLVPMIAEAARGLQALHITGGVHHGIRPESLFLAGDGRVLIGDINRRVEPGAVDDRGYFIAPEIWRGQSVGPAADVYALGGTAHYLATGNTPFSGDLDAQRAAHLEQGYVPPSIERPESAYFFTLISSMLAKEPLDRPDSAGEVAHLLSMVTPQSPELVITSDTTAEIDGMYIEIYTGDIAQAEADVIVNAASPDLSMDTGVGEALRHMGGDTIRDEARAIGQASLGQVVWTSAGRLQGCWVAHAVAASDGVLCIQRSTLRTLLEAQARGACSVVFPALGTGDGSVPMTLAAKLVLEAVITFARLGSEPVDQVAIALRDDIALEQWSNVLRSISTQR